MTEEWASYWIQCLSANSDYTDFRIAAERGDTEKCLLIERKIKGITELYRDFGRVFGIIGSYETCQDWKNWFEPRRHLFLSSPKTLLAGEVVSDSRSKLNLEIPLHATAKETIDSVARFINSHYENNEVSVADTPKYQLHKPYGLLLCGLQAVKRAVMTSYRSYAYEMDGSYRSIDDASKEFLRHEIGELGWCKNNKDLLQRLQSGAEVTEDEWELLLPRVREARRTFVKLSSSAVRGRFPDDTVQESKVLCQFWGEEI